MAEKIAERIPYLYRALVGGGFGYNEYSKDIYIDSIDFGLSTTDSAFKYFWSDQDPNDFKCEGYGLSNALFCNEQIIVLLRAITTRGPDLVLRATTEPRRQKLPLGTQYDLLVAEAKTKNKEWLEISAVYHHDPRDLPNAHVDYFAKTHLSEVILLQAKAERRIEIVIHQKGFIFVRHEILDMMETQPSHPLSNDPSHRYHSQLSLVSYDWSLKELWRNIKTDSGIMAVGVRLDEWGLSDSHIVAKTPDEVFALDPNTGALGRSHYVGRWD